MVDVWLIFAQVVPWIEVLLHTVIDWMRTDEEEEREVNHHGRTITVEGGKRNEDKEVVRLQMLGGMKGRPRTGPVSREAFANMTQVNR